MCPCVPAAAIEHGQDDTFVYVVKPDSTVAVQKISIGYQTDGFAVIKQGLNGGEQVVTSGQSRLEAGVRVQPCQPKANT